MKESFIMDDRQIKTEEAPARLVRYLSPLSVWALSFGCAVGWGAFVMPGTTFLPVAGPLGTALGIAIGAVIMLVIGVNYHYLMNKYPDAGGTLTYSARTFGYDHGFLSAWFLILVYVAIIWANATGLALICRNLFGTMFQFGFHYQLLGYDIWMGEILLSAAVIVLFGLVCICGKRLAVRLQTLLALLLFAGIVICAFCVFKEHEGGLRSMEPAFSPNGGNPVKQIFIIMVLSPWAFVGFESVSNSTAGFKFPVKRSIWIMAAALVCGAIAYILLTETAAAVLPEGYSDWDEYMADLENHEGISGLPVFYAVSTVMGNNGMIILGIAAMSAILTGAVGNFIAASRLIYSMAEENILPEWFGRLNSRGVPKNAFIFLICISLVIPFLGRTAIGWIVDVNTVGASIAYGYTSAAALADARKERNIKIQATGAVGLVMSVVFFFYFMASSSGTMATESYLILALWSILGFLYFRYVFRRDKDRRFGKSTVVWIGLLFLIFFTSLMWVKQATDDMTETVIYNVSAYYEERNVSSMDLIVEAQNYLSDQLREVDALQIRNMLIQMALIIVSLAIMFSIYTTMSKRERSMELEKFRAEENSRAKSTFLSNMSHDIRTPMNAIIGYVNLAERDGVDQTKMKEYVGKIKNSSQHLLALINDVLEMSRIESGKMELEPVPTDLKRTLADIYDMFAMQMREKGIAFSADTSDVKNSLVYCDENRLNRVLLNLISNAYKFTPEGGSVNVTLRQTDNGENGDIDTDHGDYELSVADTGMGMTQEFAAKVFEAFERERNAAVDGIQGTGLGMAITKNIVDLMGGTIDVITELGKGTEFVVKLKFELQTGDGSAYGEENGGDERQEQRKVYDLGKIRVLLADCMEYDREVARELLNHAGAKTEEAANGREAVEMVARSAPGYYDAVLMDIEMPVMNGYDAARAIRGLDDPGLANIPIIAVTANAFSEDVKKAEYAGMNGHIAKPVDIYELYDKLEAVQSGELQPLRDTERDTGQKTDEKQVGALSGRRILLAEDVEINAELMKELLEMYGAETEHAPNGKAAADMFAERPAHYYDAVLMDMQMPVMNGLEATASIRGLDREDAGSIPVIALTGDTSSENVKQALEAGMNAYLSKPVDPQSLCETLENCFKELTI